MIPVRPEDFTVCSEDFVAHPKVFVAYPEILVEYPVEILMCQPVMNWETRVCLQKSGYFALTTGYENG
jgi:hypothetical protein